VSILQSFHAAAERCQWDAKRLATEAISLFADVVGIDIDEANEGIVNDFVEELLERHTGDIALTGLADDLLRAVDRLVFEPPEVAALVHRYCGSSPEAGPTTDLSLPVEPEPPLFQRPPTPPPVSVAGNRVYYYGPDSETRCEVTPEGEATWKTDSSAKLNAPAHEVVVVPASQVGVFLSYLEREEPDPTLDLGEAFIDVRATVSNNMQVRLVCVNAEPRPILDVYLVETDEDGNKERYVANERPLTYDDFMVTMEPDQLKLYLAHVTVVLQLV
jgi:hypothetical protein